MNETKLFEIEVIQPDSEGLKLIAVPDTRVGTIYETLKVHQIKPDLNGRYAVKISVLREKL